MNETIKNLVSRRSVKSYSDKQVNDEDLKLIVEAGTYAPNGRGLQSPKIVVIQNKDIIEKLKKLNAELMGNSTIDPCYNAPTIILVLADKNVPTYIEDGSLAIGNMLNAAFSLGIDSCWIHRAKEELETLEGKRILNDLNIDSDKYVGIGHCILGYRNIDLPDAKPRKSDYIVYVK